MTFMSKQYHDDASLKKLGDRVKFFRNKLKINQEELAYRCEMSRSYLTDIERGIRNVAFSNIVKLCNGLNITLEIFFKSF